MDRLLGCRKFKPEELGTEDPASSARRLEAEYQERQRTFIKTLDPELVTIAEHAFEASLLGFKGCVEEAEEHHADPHPKKALRTEAWRQANLFGTAAKWDHWMEEECAKGKIKVEIAKAGKIVRIYVDLTVLASLRGAWLTDALKGAMAKPWIWGRTRVIFMKSVSASNMGVIKQSMLDADFDVDMVYFSDDVFLKVNGAKGPRFFNLDISSCDASHTEELFELLARLVPTSWREDVEALIGQCKAPLKLASIVDKHDKPRKVILKFHSARLFSGSTLTTLINNIACLLMASAISKGCKSEAGIKEACAKAGYKVTLDEVVIRGDAQFLKHSPLLDLDGKERWVLNFGVLLRTWGSCRGDLPGSGPLLQRARDYQAGLLKSMYPRVECPILKSMRREFGVPTVETKAFKYGVQSGERFLASIEDDLVLCTDEEFLARYRLTPEEIAQVQAFARLPVGFHAHLSGLGKILEKDYELGLKILPEVPLLYDKTPNGPEQ
jgi:hypothetical protein